MFPELVQNLTSWMGFYFWKPLKNFKLEEHVYLHEMSDVNSQVKKFVNSLTTKSWTRDKALWEMIIIPNVKPWSNQSFSVQTQNEGPNFLVIFRLHHALMDGFSVLKFMSGMDESGNISKVVNPRLALKSRNITFTQKLLKCVKILCKVPYDIAYALLEPAADKQLWDLNVGQTLTGECVGTSLNMFTVSEVKNVKNVLGVSFSALVVSVITGGIRHLLLKKSNKKLPGRLHFRFPVPLSGHSSKMRNHM